MTRIPKIAALVALAAMLASAAAAEMPDQRQGWVIIDTELGFEELNLKLETAIEAAGMGLVTSASASAGARAQGFEIPGNRVVGVYRNDYARRMLEASTAAGIEAPIRFYVTEDADGTATLSYKTPGTVFAPYMDEGGQTLADLASELDAVFDGIATGATSGGN